jgi:hypothetical protein
MTEEGIKRGREAAHATFWELVDGDDLTDYPLMKAIDAFLSELGKTHVVVPREPTAEMICAGIAERHGQPVPEAWSLATQNIWKAMIAAASDAK